MVRSWGNGNSKNTWEKSKNTTKWFVGKNKFGANTNWSQNKKKRHKTNWSQKQTKK